MKFDGGQVEYQVVNSQAPWSLVLKYANCMFHRLVNYCVVVEGVFQVELPHYVMTARQNGSNVGADIEKQTSLLLQTVSASCFLVGY